MGKLDGKVVILTGAAGGLGKQMAIRFANEGAKLALCDILTDRLRDTARLCEEQGAEVLAMTCDVSSFEQLKIFVQNTADRFGTVDVLVNNAVSIANPRPFLDQDVSMLDSSLKTGLYSTWHLMQLCFPYLKTNGGSIINFGSGAGYSGMAGHAAYAACKEAIRGLSRVVANEWGQYGIRVNILNPGAITENVKAGIDQVGKEIREAIMAAFANNPLRRIGDPYEDVTPVAVFLACDDSRYMTGQDLRAEGGGIIHA